ncbi:MAG: tRNA dihydrouridine synthase DusB [Parachlamydiales bacterium]|jgi:nifR3 family TIM-barrel protein
MSFKQEFKINNLLLDSNILFAPLAEYTDFAFRRFIRHYHKGLMFCEMIKMEALIREKSYKILKYTKDMSPIGAQLCGSDSRIVSDAAKIVEDLGFQIIDLNCGCPVPKVVKDGSGAAMLKTPLLISQMLSLMTKAVKIPVTVKIRLGWDENSICAKEIVKIAEEAGCSAITIHGRTKKQGYSGKSDWNYIKECKEQAKKILVFGNGDVYSPKDADEMFKLTNCDGIMVARGFLYNPNISNEIERYFLNNAGESGFDKKNSILRYIDYIIEEKGSEKAIFDVRRICGWLLKEVRDIKQLRIHINKSDNIEEVRSLINSFDWDGNHERENLSQNNI